MKIDFRPAVPAAVRAVAITWFNHSRSNHPGNRAIRLLTNPQMDQTWINLKRHKSVMQADAFITENFGTVLFLSGVQDMSIDEKAFAALFLMSIKVAAQDGCIATEGAHLARIERYKQAADIIKEAASEGYDVDEDFDEVLETALDYSRRYIIRRVFALTQDYDPSRLSKSGGKWSVMKSAARDLTYLTTNVFGTPLDKIIAEFENAIFEPDDWISEEETKAWRKEKYNASKRAAATRVP